MSQEKYCLSIQGMTCQACATRIEKVLKKQVGVEQATVNFASEEVQLIVQSSQTDLDTLIKVIKKTGFEASPKKEQMNRTTMTGRLLVLWGITLVFLIGMFGMMIGHHEWMLPAWWQFALASVVQAVLAIPFYQSAWGSIKGRLANMDVLVSIGTLAIYFYSVYQLFAVSQHDHGMPLVYFEASVMVIGFVSLGKFIEDRAKKDSLNSLSLLLKLRPTQVERQTEQGWERVPLDRVLIGDMLRANQGDRIAADGVVRTGYAWTDESHLTGEYRPEEKKEGALVLAGALVSQGSIVYEAQQLGEKTLLGDMMAALSEAQGSKAPIARLADKVAAVFVPVVLLIALLTFVVTLWYQESSVALMNAVAVLVIACPCALGLATPAAIMVGMGQAIRRGIWFKDATVMEEASLIDTVVFDKTGTLTEGKPQLVAMKSFGAISEETLLQIVASVEQGARHPLASALVQAAQNRHLSLLEPEQVSLSIGEGVTAYLQEFGEVRVGKPSFCGIDTALLTEEVWQRSSLVGLSLNQVPIGVFALADALRPDALASIHRLKEHHIEVYMMSGDHPSAVRDIAKQLGIEHAQGQMSPRDKAERVQALKQAGRKVAMVGDGINDAPALAIAQVSFAMKEGADIAQNTASATLMQPSIRLLVDALLIAKATKRTIVQNLFFAFIYNALGIPLAALGFLSPLLAGLAMTLSSLSVLLNALRLKYFSGL